MVQPSLLELEKLMSIRSTLISLAGVGALTFAATPALAETSEAGQQSVLHGRFQVESTAPV